MTCDIQDHQQNNCTTEWLIDELTYRLGLKKSFYIEHETGTIRISHKYYDQAEWVLPRLNICEPPPEFVIYVSDLTRELKTELSNLRSTPETLDRVVTGAITGILESVNCRYYHISGVATRIRWRFDP